MTIKPIVRSRRPSANGQCLIYISYQHKGRTVLFSTGYHIKPDYLVNKRGRILVDSTIDISNAKKNESIIKFRRRSDESINRILEEMQAEIMEVVADIRHEGFEPETNLVKFKYEASKGKFDAATDESKIKTINEAIQYNIDFNPALKSELTKKNYVNLGNKVKGFLSHKRRSGDLAELSNSFTEDFQKYLSTELELSENSVWGHLKSLKAVTQFVINRGIKLNLDPSRIKPKSIKGMGLYLTQSEFKRLWQLDLSDTPRLERVRDLFCLQAQTGLRVSDLQRLKKAHIKEDLIKIRTLKTNTDILIPITEIARSILKKYSFQLPVISSQNYNEYLKEVCAVAAINEEIEIPDYRNGKKTYTTKLKYELISNHDAIRTFITHGVENGITPKVMSMITGKSLKTLLNHYYQSDESRVLEEVKKAFSQNPQKDE